MPAQTGLKGGAFDGRYVYFVPYDNGVYDGITARFDTQFGQPNAFTTAAAWSTFDIATVHAGAIGMKVGAFDGRYVYYAPIGNNFNSGLVPRFDTAYGGASPFTTPKAWSTIDLTVQDPNAIAYKGAVFDGRYLYFVPVYGSVVARFDAKTPASKPAWYSGSFF